MSLDNIPPPKLPANDEPNTSADGGATGGRKTSLMKPPAQTLKCPRCDSPNTKFCYYNNYSLTQPRHFCKTCRRYWTKGGALRSVPIGGGCRKSRKSRSSSSRFINGDSSSKSSSLDMGELSLFKGFNPPAMDYQLGGLNQLSSTQMINPPPFLNLDSLGLNFPLVKQDIHQHFQEIGVSNNLASSIESLSSINQDLHWKLQQQRLAALFNGGASGSGGGGGVIEQQSQAVMESQAQKLQPMFFQNLEIPKASQTSMTAGDLRIDDQSGDLQTEWFFDGSYAPVNVDSMTTNGNNSGNYDNGSMSNWSNGIQGSNQFNQYNALQ